MNNIQPRREFLKKGAVLAGILGTTALGGAAAKAGTTQPLFKISLAQWSLHKALFAKEIDPLDFAKIARNEFDIEGLEYVNQFFKDKAEDQNFLAELKKRAGDYGVRSLLIMCDGEGQLGDPDASARTRAVENHHKWVEAAKYLGCHSIRVNAASAGSYEEQVKLAADGLARLAMYASKFGLKVIVENHGGLSSNGSWLTQVMKTVNLRNCGTLPDFGNFRINGDEWYDRYQGVRELMPYAYAVSAKTHDFNELGNEAHTDYYRMMKIVVDAGYRGYVGIEYEGSQISEMEGIAKSKELLLRVRDVLS